MDETLAGDILAAVEENFEAQVAFTRGPGGEVTGLLLTQGGTQQTARRIR